MIFRGYAVTFYILAIYIALYSINKRFNPTLHIRRRSSVGKAIDLLALAHCTPLFSSNNVRLLAYVLTGDDPQLE